MTDTTEIEPLSVWWADIKLEISVGEEFYVSRESFERPVLIIDNKAYLVFKVTSRLGREGYRIRDLSVAGLPRESVIRTDTLVPISVSDLRYKMGVLSRADRIGLRSYMENHDSPRIIEQKRRFRKSEARLVYHTNNSNHHPVSRCRKGEVHRPPSAVAILPQTLDGLLELANRGRG